MAEIGRVGAQRREVTGLNPSVNPDAFGAGVARALGSMSGQLGGLARTRASQEEADTSLSQAYRQRQNRISSARLQADLIRLDNEMSRELSERYDAAGFGAPGFTDDTNTWAQSRYQQFMQNVPEDLRPDFEPTIERMLQEKTNVAFKLQVSSENAEFTKTIMDLQSQAREEMLTAPYADLDQLEADWMEDLTQIMQNSPMDAQSTRELAEGITNSISAAKMLRDVKEDALDNVSAGGTLPGQLKQDGRRIYSDRPVAAGLGRAAVGFLQGIAGPESGGDYNVMYSPDGRRYFDDFSWHPNQSAVIASGPNAGKNSTAAGRYQFIYSTWVAVAEELGLTDFSPESQDRAAWHLAQKDYRARTGRDLQAVLESGNQPAIAEARRILTPTWEGLGNISDANFIDAIASATGNPSSALFDEQYSHLPYEQRLAIISDGLAEAERIRAQMAAEAAAQRSAMIAQANRSLFEGSGGMQDILRLRQQINLSVEEEQGLVNTFKQNQTDRYNAERMLTSIGDENFIFDPSSGDHKDMAGSFFTQTQAAQRFAEQDSEYVDNLVLPLVEKANGFIPSNIAGMLVQQMQSQNTGQAEFALQTLAKLFAEAPSGFDTAFDQDTMNQVAFFNAAQGSLPLEEILTHIRGQRDPITAQSRQVLNSIYQDALKDRPDDFNPQGIAQRLFGRRTSVDPATGRALYSEFYSLYQYQLGLSGDHRKAVKATDEILKSRWGETNIGERGTMKYPPEQVYPAFNGSMNWIGQQLLEEFPALNGQRYALRADHITDAEKNSGAPPSYRIVQFNEWGHPSPVTESMHINGGESMVPARWYPQITEAMQNDLITQREQMGTRGGRVDPTSSPEPVNRIGEALEEMGGMREFADSSLIHQILRDMKEKRGQDKDLRGRNLPRFRNVEEE